jgi:amino acid transporter
MIGGRRSLKGRKIADRRVRVARPHSPFFRYAGPGQLVARPAASQPTTASGRFFARVRAGLIGRPLASEEEIGERLSKKKALAIFSSDAISSSAYATEEILRILLVAGAAMFLWSVPVAIAIAVLLGVVALSYRQLVHAYPNGGGAYAVARANFAPIVSLVAAAALLIDYVMTVAVSTASAIAQLVSISPALFDIRVEIGLAAIILITLGNMRGIRESGNIFAVPTYLFVGMALLMVGLGIFNVATGSVVPSDQPDAIVPPVVQPITILLLLRAFAGGSVALTGVEAIANGVPAFKPPEPRNAAATLVAMALLLGVLFIGITFVADAYEISPTAEGGPTVVAQVADAVFGDGSPLFLVFQLATALILFLAANTSFNAFPRLAALLAQDGYMPRQFSFRGDRLSYSWGIMALAAIACALLVIFQGDTHALIPLYSVGVFICFTISQAGMVRHWLAERDRGWRAKLLLNSFGALLTGVVLVVVASAKFIDGAWIVLVLVPLQVVIFMFISSQYRASRDQLAVPAGVEMPVPHRRERVVVPVPGLNRAVVQAVNVGRSISDDVRAVYITDDAEEAGHLRRQWELQVPGVPIVVVESPYRALVGPLVAYLDVLDRSWPPDQEAPITFVVVPEYVARHWWERILYNQSARRLRSTLLGRPMTVVVDVPYRREDPDGPRTGARDGAPPGE